MGSDPIASERLTRSGREWLPPTVTHRSDIPVLARPCFHGLRRHQLVLSFPASEGVSFHPIDRVVTPQPRLVYFTGGRISGTLLRARLYLLLRLLRSCTLTCSCHHEDRHPTLSPVSKPKPSYGDGHSDQQTACAAPYSETNKSDRGRTVSAIEGCSARRQYLDA